MRADAARTVGLTEARLTAWGEKVGAAVRPPALFALRGQLGAGKSVLARAIARAAGVQANMPSPTFNLVLEYHAPNGVLVKHIDLYRLQHPDQVWPLGWSDLGAANEIVLIEWPERAGDLLPATRWDVFIEPVAEDSSLRRVEVHARGGAAPLLTPE